MIRRSMKQEEALPEPVPTLSPEIKPQLKRRAPRKTSTTPRKRKARGSSEKVDVPVSPAAPLVQPVQTMVPVLPVPSVPSVPPAPMKWVSSRPPPGLPVAIEIVPGRVAACYDLFVGGFIRMVDGRMVPTEDPGAPSIMVPRQELQAAKNMVTLQGYSTLISVNKNDPSPLTSSMGMKLVCLHFDPKSADTLTYKTMRAIINLIDAAINNNKKCLITGSSGSNMLRYFIIAYMIHSGWSLKAAVKLIEEGFFPVTAVNEKVVPDAKSSSTALKSNAVMWKNLLELEENLKKK